MCRVPASEVAARLSGVCRAGIACEKMPTLKFSRRIAIRILPIRANRINFNDNATRKRPELPGMNVSNKRQDIQNSTIGGRHGIDDNGKMVGIWVGSANRK